MGRKRGTSQTGEALLKPFADRLHHCAAVLSLFLHLRHAALDTALCGSRSRLVRARLRADDEFAAKEQQRALRKMQDDGSGVKPAYCDSRYYRILAGGNGQGGVGCGGQ